MLRLLSKKYLMTITVLLFDLKDMLLLKICTYHKKIHKLLRLRSLLKGYKLQACCSIFTKTTIR